MYLSLTEQVLTFNVTYIIMLCVDVNVNVSLYNSNELGAEMMTTNADTIRYATSGGVSNVSTDTKRTDLVLHGDPMQDYEDVEVPVNPLPIPPKPQAKSKKPAIKSATNPSHARSRRQGPQQPAMRPSPHYQFQDHVQQPERSPSPIYESPD